MVEAALIIPVAIFLMVGVVDFGWGFQTWATGNKSVRDAARYLGGLPSWITTTCPGWAVTNAKNLAVYGNISGSGSPLVPGWQVGGGSNNDVFVDCSGTLPSGEPTIVVTGKFPYNPLILAAFMPLSNPRTLSAQHTEISAGD